MFKFLRRPKLHVFYHVAPRTRYYKGFAAVKCKFCEQKYVMDMVVGWMMEWDFVLVENEKYVDVDNFDQAIAHLRSSYHNPEIKNHMWDRCDN